MPMDILDLMRTQYCVYWSPAGLDDDGRERFGVPRELRVRWEDTNELFKSATGEDVMSKAKVYTGEDVQLDGVMWRGRLAQVPRAELNDPFRRPGASKIARFDKLPLIEVETEEDYVRTAWL